MEGIPLLAAYINSELATNGWLITRQFLNMNAQFSTDSTMKLITPRTTIPISRNLSMITEDVVLPMLSCGSKFRLALNETNGTYNKQSLSRKLALLLDISCRFNDPGATLPSPKNEFSEFFSSTRQKFVLADYIQYLMEETQCSASVFILAYLYLQRAQAAVPLLKVNSYNVHRLYFTCIVLAAKYMEHSVLSNKDMASIGGLSCLKEINTLELSMLKILGYKLGCHVHKYSLLCQIILQ